MKITIQFSNKYRKPEDIVGLLARENINQRILDIINNKSVRGYKVVDYKNRPQYRIYFEKI
jgi:hypothetical protein